MTGVECIARIKRGMGFRTDLDADILISLNEAQNEFEGAASLPLFLAVEDDPIVIPAGTRSIALPPGFIKTVEDDSIHFTAPDRTASFLVRKPFDEAYNYYSEWQAGSLRAYSIRASTLYFWPEGDSDVTYYWSWYKQQPQIVEGSSTDNAWLMNVPLMLVGRAGMLLAGDLEDDDAMKRFENLYARWKGWLMGRIAEQEQDSRPYAMGRNS